LFIIALLLLWLPLAAPIHLYYPTDSNSKTILTMGLLFADFLLLLQYWGKHVHEETQLLSHYGLQWTRLNGIDFLNGLCIGLLFTSGLFILEALVGWVQFQPPPMGLVGVIGEGALTGLGVAFAEELLFRGWLLDELERDYSQSIACWLNAIIFALLHFLKPITEVIRTFPQFPSLVLLGLTLVWAKRRRRGRLGVAIGLHGGLVWGYYIVNVGELVTYSNKISPLITGVDGNPLAGVTGLVFLAILAVWTGKKRIKWGS